MNYSAEVREAVVRKAATRAAPQRAIAEEFGVSVTTVQNWVREYRHNGSGKMAKGERRPQDWTAEERLEALIKTARLSEAELGSWCRRHGVHTHHLAQWRRELTAARSGGKASSETRALREENRDLKKALRRKEKALAETAALLVLKKKAESIWGEREDD